MSDTYLEPQKVSSIDTSIYHDYKVVVKKGFNSNYTYDLYVDSVLAWENAYNETGFGTSILKIGIDGETKVGEKAALDLDLDSVYTKLI